MNWYMISVFFTLIIISMAPRALPFIFTDALSKNENLKLIGKKLSGYIMMILVIHEIKPESVTKFPYAIPGILSLILVIIVHIYLRKPLLSMFLGTLSFIIIQN